MTIRLSLVCHAATAATRAASFPGDEPLEPRALARAAALAPLLGAASAAWTGPEMRCRQTAEALGLAASVAADLRECDYGSWSGRRLAAIEQEHPAAIAAWISDPAAAPHGGESLRDLLARAASWLASIRRDGPVVAVTHASLIRAIVIEVLAAPPASFWRLDIAPLSVTDLRFAQERWSVRSAGCLAAEPPVPR